jgi:sporulation protein YlmC with PRC-barrel domain
VCSAMRLKLGTRARCTDGVVGMISDVVVDPAPRRVTHVVVETGKNVARLVPIELVGVGAGRNELTLDCTFEELHRYELIRRYAYLEVDEFPQSDDETDVGVEDMIAMPYSGNSEFGDYAGELDTGVSITYDRIPKGEAELRRSSEVVSQDGHHLGHVDGVLVAGIDVTHVVLEHGHFWRKRDVAIPIADVQEIATDRVTAALGHDELPTLPRVH